MEKISFVILTYNSYLYVENCLKSILQITNYITEIYIIDNGSIDGTSDILDKYKLENKNIHVTKLDKNYGTTYSRNIGLHQIKDTDYICILDSDTEINNNAINKMVEFIKQNDKIGLVGPAMKNKLGEKQIPYRKFPNWKIKLMKACPIKSISKKGEKKENYTNIDFSKPFESEYLISACWIMTYETYKIIGDFDEKIFYSPEDVDYCIRIWENNLKVIHVPNAQIIHIYQRISKKKLISKTNFSHINGLRYLFKKHKKFLKKYRKSRVH